VDWIYVHSNPIRKLWGDAVLPTRWRLPASRSAATMDGMLRNKYSGKILDDGVGSSTRRAGSACHQPAKHRAPLGERKPLEKSEQEGSQYNKSIMRPTGLTGHSAQKRRKHQGNIWTSSSNRRFFWESKSFRPSASRGPPGMRFSVVALLPCGSGNSSDIQWSLLKPISR